MGRWTNSRNAGGSRRPWPGRPFPLGATWDGRGTNFALYAEQASAVQLCLFDAAADSVERQRVTLREQTAHVWHAYLPGIGPGQTYGYRVDGEYDPARGIRFNASKLLIDPYARAIAGKVDWQGSVYGYKQGHPDADLVRDDCDDAAAVPKAVVVDPTFDWADDRPPHVPWHESFIYELHVKGFTERHPAIPCELQGTYSGLAHPSAIEHLKALGVTAVELLPVHAFTDEPFLAGRGLSNYWGYNTIGYFAPEGSYSNSGTRGEQVTEFKRMVQALHSAGIEVILDVVYNHTAEGNHLGPTLSFRGIDNGAYYRLVEEQPRFYMDFAGTGNTLNVRHPQVLQLIMDSLRYWVLEMHVDGFRFDLASALARELYDVDRLSAFFDIIHQDPVLSRVKLIAEPWDVGKGGYQVGNFPVLWTEWNDMYRDSVRAFWRGDHRPIAEMGYRLTGSSDLYQADGRRPYASINFVTSHDGFTLNDLVSYEEKHNEANGEQNRDGSDHNVSANHGVEGPTDDPAIVELRERQKRNFLATLMLSQGVPMLCGGDEIGRTQHGNNNGYCQDNELSWLDWNLDEHAKNLMAFVERLVQIRSSQPVLRRRKFFQGRKIRNSEIKDLTWFRPDGEEMTDAEWTTSHQGTLALRLAGDAIDEDDAEGNRISGDTLLILLNAEPTDVNFRLPRLQPSSAFGWQVLIDTGEVVSDGSQVYEGGAEFAVTGKSLVLCRRCEKVQD